MTLKTFLVTSLAIAVQGNQHCDEEAGVHTEAGKISLLQQGYDVKTHFQANDKERAQKLEEIIAAKMPKRLWTICEIDKLLASSAEAQVQHKVQSTPANCTKSFSFTDLCCADFGNLAEGGLAFDTSLFLNLEASKHATCGSKAGGMLPSRCDGASKSILVCTSDFDLGSSTSGTVGDIQCARQQLCHDEVRGIGDFSSTQPGEQVLNVRIAFLMNQDIPANSIPTCKETVKKCSDGSSPASASQSTLDTLAGVGLLDINSIKDDNFVSSLIESDGFFSALMTSGSFMMMQAGAF